MRRPFLQSIGLSTGTVVAQGLARFAYALLLPPMRQDLHWTYTQAGAMNTANAVGYLAGAAGATWLVTCLRLRPLFLVSLALTGLCVLGCAATPVFALLAALRLGAGAAGAVAFVAGAALTVHAGAGLPPRRATLALGIYVAGGGTGIAASGLLLPPLLAATGPADGWRLGWLVLGVVSLVTLVPAALATSGVADGTEQAPAGAAGWPRRRLAATGLAYLLFGAGYVGYTTFVVALLLPDTGPGLVGVFWVVLGLVAASAAVAWGPQLGRFRGGRGLALLLAMTAIGAAGPAVTTGLVPALASAVLFGGAFLSVVTAVATVVRHTVPPHAWGPAIGALTAGFAAGQCVGPLLAGAVSDQAGVHTGMGLSAALLAVGALVALAQPHAPSPASGTRR